DVLHDDHRNTLARVDGVDDADVGVVERGRRPCLGQQRGRGHGASRAEDFKRHLAVEGQIARAEYSSKRSAAQLFFDPVGSHNAIRPEFPAGVEYRVATPALTGAGPSRLQTIEDAKNLIGIASDREAVNDLVLKDAVGVDEEKPANGYLLPLEVH